MSMSRRFAIALVLAALPAVAVAAPKWNGAGWYVVAEFMGGAWLEKGPFASKDACESAKPPYTGDEVYNCEYLSARPGFDD
jgi:hypothetical protein